MHEYNFVPFFSFSSCNNLLTHKIGQMKKKRFRISQKGRVNQSESIVHTEWSIPVVLKH